MPGSAGGVPPPPPIGGLLGFLGAAGPGLYFLVLAAALLWLLGRAFDPVPPRTLAAFAVVLALFFGPVLFGGRILLPLTILRSVAPFRTLPPDSAPEYHLLGDQVRQIAPWALEVRRELEAGRWPLWNPHLGAGMPLLGDPQSQAFAPLTVAAYPLDFWAGLGVTAALRVLLALVFFFLLLRRQGLAEPAALTGSLAYGCGSFLLLWLGWPIANAAAWLPVALYAVARLSPAASLAAAGPASADEPGPAETTVRPLLHRDLALLSFAGFALFLGGHPETVMYALGLAAVFALARALSLPRPARARFLGGAAAAMAVAGLAAAPVLLPAAGYLPTTERSAQIAFALSPRPVAELWHDLLQPGTRAFWRKRAAERLVPLAAPRAYGDYDRFWGRDNLIELAAGFVGTAALLAALAALVSRRRLPQERLMIGVLGISLALLAQPPGFDRLVGRLPILGATAVHTHHRILLLISAALAYLAACGVERFRRGEGRRGPLLAIAGALALLLPWVYLRETPPVDPPVPAHSPAFWVALQLALLLAAVALLLGARRFPAAPWVLAALVGGELVLLNHDANLACSRHLAFPTTAPARFLAARLGPARMVGLGSAFLPNFPSVFGFSDVRIDNPSLPRAYAQAIAPLFEPDQLVPVFSRPRHPLYDLLGVRYVATPVGLEVPLPRVFAAEEGWIYERPHPLPLFFLPDEARIYRGEFFWPRFLARNRSFARRALVAASPEGADDWQAANLAPSTAALVRRTSSRLTIATHLAERRLLASSLYQDGHWHALVDGAPRRPLWSNGPFAAVWLAAGEHRVELLYRPATFVAGCLLAALALAGGAALWVLPPWGKGQRT